MFVSEHLQEKKSCHLASYSAEGGGKGSTSISL